ncbi:MAG: hypothetical protein JRD05_10870 [Deltaproteobacteria bacterium]|nr:hypothetical protein [Deltaproteobacteria bacterium]
MFRNRWPECSGMGGRNGAEWVAGIKRNMHRYPFRISVLAFAVIRNGYM